MQWYRERREREGREGKKNGQVEVEGNEGEVVTGKLTPREVNKSV